MRRLVLCAAIVTAALVEGSALAEGNTRFRGGVGASGGFLDLDGGFAVAIGPYGHVGVQLDDTLGLFGVFDVDAILVNDGDGVRVRHALGVDWTLADRVSLGLGPSLGALVGPGGAEVEAGGLLHLAAYPWMKRDAASHVRKGLALSIDVTPAAMLGDSAVFALQARYAVHAALGIGYEIF